MQKYVLNSYCFYYFDQGRRSCAGASCILYKLFGWLEGQQIERRAETVVLSKNLVLSLAYTGFIFCCLAQAVTLQQTKQHNWINKSWVCDLFFSDGDLSNKNGETGRFDHVYVFQSLLMYCTPPSVIYPDSQRQFIAKVLIPFQNNMLETTAYWHIEKG